MNQITYSGYFLSINGNSITLPYQIIDAFESQDLIIVFLDPDANLGKYRQFRNLIAYDSHGVKIWEAQLPTSKTSDVYWKVASKSPLIAYSFSSYECEIDITNGNILKKEFYK